MKMKMNGSQYQHKTPGRPRLASQRYLILVLVLLVLGLTAVLVWAAVTGKFKNVVTTPAPAPIPPPDSGPGNGPSSGGGGEGDGAKDADASASQVNIGLVVGLGVALLFLVYLVWVLVYITVLRPRRAQVLFDRVLRFRKGTNNKQRADATRLFGTFSDDENEEMERLVRNTVLPRYLMRRRRMGRRLTNTLKERMGQVEEQYGLAVADVERMLPRTYLEGFARVLSRTGSAHVDTGEQRP